MQRPFTRTLEVLESLPLIALPRGDLRVRQLGKGHVVLRSAARVGSCGTAYLTEFLGQSVEVDVARLLVPCLV